MSKHLKTYNFFSMQILFQDRTRMSEILDVMNQVEKMGGNVADITIQVVRAEAENNHQLNDAFEETPSNFYGKYKN